MTGGDVHKGVRDQYDAKAAAYDARWSYYTYATTTAALACLNYAGTERVLDLGCGTGELARLLLAQWPALWVVGVDVSAGMLARGAAKLRSNPHVHFLAASVTALPCADASFDAVVTTNAFHYFRDPARACAEMLRVLRPGGRVLVVDWCHDYLTCKLCQWYLRLTDPAHYRMYTLRQCAGHLTAAGFETGDAHRFKISPLWGLMTVTGTKQAPGGGAPPTL